MNGFSNISYIKAGSVVILLLGLIWVISSERLIAGIQWENYYTESTKTSGERIVAGHPVLENLSDEPVIVEVELTASKERLSLVPGIETDVYAYNHRTLARDAPAFCDGRQPVSSGRFR